MSEKKAHDYQVKVINGHVFVQFLDETGEFNGIYELNEMRLPLITEKFKEALKDA